MASVYQQARDKLLRTRQRLPSEKHLRLALFAAHKRREGLQWEAIMKEWNRELAVHFRSGRYSEVRNFIRDAGTAQRRVLEAAMRAGALWG